jgi:hypothetical protein
VVVDERSPNAGDRFAALVVARLGPDVRASARPLDDVPGSYFIDVDWNERGDGLLFIATDRADGVTVLDPHDEWLSESDALTYITSRKGGASARQALREVRRSRR